MNNEVKHIINLVLPISPSSFELMEKHLGYYTIPKGEIFIKRDRENSKEYFLIGGIYKSYVTNPGGDEITISFFLKNSILSPHHIRTSGDKSNLNFKALSDLRMASIDVKFFESLMIENQEFRSFGNLIVQNELKTKVEKEIGLASLTAKERLLAFREQFRSLENTIPHTDIASYLGITNISLSRLRRELMS